MATRGFIQAVGHLVPAVALFLLFATQGCGVNASTAVIENQSAQTLVEVELALVADERTVLQGEALAAGGVLEVTLPAKFSEGKLLFSGRVDMRPIHADCGYIESSAYRARIVVLADLTAACTVDLYP